MTMQERLAMNLIKNMLPGFNAQEFIAALQQVPIFAQDVKERLERIELQQKQLIALLQKEEA